MDLGNLDKAYIEYDNYMRKVKGFATMPSKLDFRLWEEWKIENGYEENTVNKKDSTENKKRIKEDV